MSRSLVSSLARAATASIAFSTADCSKIEPSAAGFGALFPPLSEPTAGESAVPEPVPKTGSTMMTPSCSAGSSLTALPSSSSTVSAMAVRSRACASRASYNFLESVPLMALTALAISPM